MSRTTKEKLIKRAKKLHRRERFKQCLKIIDRILKTYPDEQDILLLKMDVLFRLSKYHKIRKTALEFLDNSPNEESDYLITIEYLQKTGNYDLRNDVIDESLISCPTSKYLNLFKANSLYKGSDSNEKVFEFIDSFSKSSPLWKDLMCFKAKIYIISKEYEKSLEVYDEILKSSFDLKTLSRKLKTLKILERDSEANEILDNMIVEGIEKNWALVNKGLYLEGKNNQIAMEFIDEAIENDPDYSFSHYGKASVSLDMGDYKQANEYIKKILSSDEEGFGEDFCEASDFIFLMAKYEYLHGDPNVATDLLDQIDYYDYVCEEVDEYIDNVSSPTNDKLVNENDKLDKKDEAVNNSAQNEALLKATVELLEKHSDHKWE